MAYSDGRNWFVSNYFASGYWNANYWCGESVIITGSKSMRLYIKLY